MRDPFWIGVLWGIGATYGVSFILALAFGLYFHRAFICTSHAKEQRRPVMADESTGDWWSQNLADYHNDGRKDAENGTFEPPHYVMEQDPQDLAENEAYEAGFMERRRRTDNSIRNAWLALRELYDHTDLLTDADCDAWETLCQHPAITHALREQTDD
jgi:hypothetical protein